MYDRQNIIFKTATEAASQAVAHDARLVCGSELAGKQFAQAPTDRPEIAAALSWLDGAVADLEAAHCQLVGRLTPVLRPETSAGCDAGVAPTAVRCAISHELEALEGRVRAVCSLTRNVLDRLAV